MRRAEGWSLAELILVIVILGILGAFVGPILLNAMRAYDMTQASTSTSAKLRYATERIAREIRDMRRLPADPALFEISAMTASTLTFVKADGKQVTIARDGATTVGVRYVDATMNALAALTDQVSGFGLAYYEQDATPVDGSTLTLMAASLAFVEFSLTLSDGASNYVSRLRLDLRNPQ